jgi:predicted enzyme related to lactoylglutathione lyase
MNHLAHSQILYVQNPIESAAFYSRLLGMAPLDQSPGFAMFALSPQGMLGLWKAPDVLPAATPAGGSELCFTLADRAAVDACLARWEAQGAHVLQRSTDMDFGYTFAVADLDGHRVRVFAAAAA